MSTQIPDTASRIIEQENAVSRIIAKSAVGSHNERPVVKRGALGDLGNTIHDLQHTKNATKGNIMGPPAPVALAKQKAVAVVPKTKKEALSSAKQKLLTNKDKENSIVLNKKILKKPQGQIQKTENKKAIEAATTEQNKHLVIYDPDEETKKDPQMVTEYVQDILTYLRGVEDEFPIREKFLEGSKVTPKMRSILVNWLVEAHQNFSMELESLHLCVSVVDRYLQVNTSVDHTIFQLVGAAALFLAAKYEEIYIPNLEEFAYICDDAFTLKQILQMEIDIFKKLDYRLGWPISIYFLRRYSKIASVKVSQHNLAKYILELALLEYNLAHVKPSIQAAAACCLAIAIINEVSDPLRVWTPTLIHYTKYKYSDFKEVVYKFAHMIANAKTSKFEAVKLKYSKPKYSKISLNFKLEGPVMRKLTLSPTSKKK